MVVDGPSKVTVIWSVASDAAEAGSLARTTKLLGPMLPSGGVPPRLPPGSTLSQDGPLIFDQVMALPYHLYVLATSGTNMEESRPMAYGTAFVLILIVLFVNLLANFLRRKLTRKLK